MTLDRGDVLLTGTPHGVSKLHVGDKLQFGLGTLSTPLGSSMKITMEADTNPIQVTTSLDALSPTKYSC